MMYYIIVELYSSDIIVNIKINWNELKKLGFTLLNVGI